MMRLAGSFITAPLATAMKPPTPILRPAALPLRPGRSRLDPRLRRLAAARFASISTASGSSGSGSSSGASHALVGGIAGGVTAFLLGYGWYHFSGTRTVVTAAQSARDHLKKGARALKRAAPDTVAPNEALEWVRGQAAFYAAFVPGGRAAVDGAFDDIGTLREKHGGEVDRIVGECYTELKKVVVDGELSFDTAQAAYKVLNKHLTQLKDLAGDAVGDVLANHPEIQKKLGPGLEALQSAGTAVGDEAKDLVQDTYGEIKSIVSNSGAGMNGDTVRKIQQLVQEKSEAIRKLGEQVWDEGLDQAKPWLDKAPAVKKLIQDNKTTLMSGGTGLKQLWDQAKQAVDSGNMEDLKKYVTDVAKKAKDKGGETGSSLLDQAQRALDQTSILGDGSGARELISKMQQMQKIIGNTDSEEIRRFVQDAVNEVKEVLEKRLVEGKKLVENSNNNSQKYDSKTRN